MSLRRTRQHYRHQSRNSRWARHLLHSDSCDRAATYLMSIGDEAAAVHDLSILVQAENSSGLWDSLVKDSHQVFEQIDNLLFGIAIRLAGVRLRRFVRFASEPKNVSLAGQIAHCPKGLFALVLANHAS